MAILNNSNAISSGGYDINNSLRFRSSASAYLSRTPASAGNRQKFTFSYWVKRGTLSAAQEMYFMNAGGGTFSQFSWTSGNVMNFSSVTASTADIDLSTTAVYRDPSAWYHVMLVVDTTQATSTNRVLIYVNGVLQIISGTYPAQNYNCQLNTTTSQNIGRPSTGTLDGYIAEYNFIDGQALTPSSFGSTNATTGVWQPAKYTGTYGTNGFYLNFNSIALTSGSNTGLGKDNSGNGNYWNTNNISVTAGTTYDAMLDVPTNTSATVANYCVMNPLSTTSTLANANLTYSSGATYCQGSMFATSGLFYAEIIATGAFASQGIAWGFSTGNANLPISTQPAASTPAGIYYVYSGGGLLNVASDGSSTNQTNPFTVGQTWQLAIDATNGYAWLGQNNVWYSSTMTATGNPVTGANPTFTISNLSTRGGLSVLCGHNTAGGTFAWNFGQRAFVYTPPTGYKALNTFNLPDSTIKKGNTVMDATLYTGNGSTQSVTNAASFKPDLVWVKYRNATNYHYLTDSVRGANLQLYSNSTDNETSTAGAITGFISNGFTLGSNTDINQNVGKYVGWQWQAGQGSTSSNTSGTITSTVSVNTTAGFSIATYTGNGTAGATIGHGLGVAPSMIIVKARSAGGANYEWVVQHKSVPASQILLLSNTIAATTSATFNSQYPSSSVIYLGSNTGANQSTITYVAYCWAEIAGYSKFGSYTGNGSADGPFVYLGFRPEFIMVKSSSSVADWNMWDTSRSPYNQGGQTIWANLQNGEYTAAVFYDILSNGFKLRDTNAESNANTQTYIYMAFAENPFKNSNAR
jgi:hypothetical protein